MAKVVSRTRRKAAPVATKKRNRRSPVEILAQLKEQRQQLADRMADKLFKLDQRIALVESRYDNQFRLAEMTESFSLEDITQQLADAKRHQKLLRLAMKSKNV